jgi:protein phosphatase
MTQPIDLSDCLTMVASSHPGQVRSNNEDSVLANPLLGLVVLADGMGGYNAGEVASGMATAVLGSELEHAFARRAPNEVGQDGRVWAREALADVIARTNAAIHHASRSQQKYSGMGTTLVMGQFFDNRVVVAHVGDSRLYRLREGAFSQLTRDHSLLQEQIDSGLVTPEQARFSRNKNLVTRALGVEATVDIDLNEFEVLPGDVYLLCSDGLNDMVEDEEIALALTSLSSNLSLCATHLIQMANDNGGRDNVSVILVRVDRPFPASGSSGNWLGLVQSWFK